MTRSKKQIAVAIVTVIILLTVGCVAWIMWQNHYNKTVRDLSSFQVQAQTSNSYGIMEDSAFLITCDSSFDKSDLKNLIRLEPAVDYTLQRQDDGQYLLTPAQPLVSNSLYNIIVGNSAVQQPRSWAFQTQRAVGVLRSYPFDGDSYTDLESGVEFTLSHKGMNIAEHFAIQPAVAGHWEYYNYTAVFVPEAPLEPNTLYTATVSAGMAGGDGLTLTEDYTVRFRTRENDGKSGGYIRLYGEFQETFTTTDPPLVALHINGFGSDPTAQAKIYRLADADAYLSVLGDYQNFITEQLGQERSYRYDAAATGLTPEIETTLPASPTSVQDSYSRYFPLPDDLGAGYYLAELTFINPNMPEVESQVTVQKLIQITDTSVYWQGSVDQGMVWLNDAAGGQTIRGATVELSPTADFAPATLSSTQSDNDGLASLTFTPDEFDPTSWQDQSRFLRILDKNGRILYVDLVPASNPRYTKPLRDQFFSMLYLDRTIYHPTDEISFWGTLLPREPGVEPPKTVQAKFFSYDYADEPAVMAEVQLKVAADGSFSGKLPFEQVVSGWYQLCILDEQGVDADDAYISNSFSISSFQKPSYITTVTPDRLYYSPGDMVNLDINTSFYEGTPASGLGYMLNFSGQTIMDLSTNHNGDVRASFTLTDKEAQESQRFVPFVSYYELTPTGAEDQYRSIYDQLLVIPRNVLVEPVLQQAKDGTYDLTLKTNKVDTTKIQPDTELWNYTSYQLAGEAVDIPLKAQIYRVDMVRTPTGSYYDFINKETRYTYDYSTRETLEKEYNLRTSQGEVTLEDLSYGDGTDFHYYVKITGVDLNNRPFTYKQNIGFISPYRLGLYDNGYKTYRFNGPDADYYLRLADESPVTLQLYENDLPAENKGRLLSVATQKGAFTPAVTRESTVGLVFDADIDPDMTVYGAYFDGRHVYRVEEAYINLDRTTKEIDLSVTTDREKYLPGDTVKATLTMTHKDGTPATGRFALGVVDEAVFAVSSQSYYAPDDLYKSLSSPGVSISLSYVQYVSDSASNPDTAGGKGGGGGGEGIFTREDFKDTATFLSGTTNQKGVATVSFTLPDNLTSWRITSVAITDDMLAGDEVVNIVVTQPFFVQPIIMERFLTDDDVTFTARARGTAGFDPAAVQYSAVLTQDERTLATLTGTGNVGSFNFGALAAGDYSVTVSAAAGDYADAVTQPFIVSESGFEMQLIQPIDPTVPLPGDDIARYPVTLSFYDAKYDVYSQAMDVLLSAYGKRIDQRVARQWAQELLAAENPDFAPYLEKVDLDDLTYQSGVSLMPYSIPDWLLTGKMCVAAPQYLSPAALIYQMETVVQSPNSQPDEVVGAYLGLAALRQPVLSDLRELVDSPSFTNEERVYLIAALGYIGDQTTAQAAYDRYIAPQIVRENDWAYLTEHSAEQNRDLTFEATTRALLAATAIRSDDATLLARYLCANLSSKTLANLELMAYMRTFDPKADVSGRFSYVDNTGKTRTVNLAKTRTHAAAFTKSALAELNFKVLSGEVKASVRYVGTPASLNLTPIQGVAITKSIQNVNGAATFVPGDLVTVTSTITFDTYAPDGYYTLSDYVPSGLRYASSGNGGGKGEFPDGSGSSFHLQSFEGQNLTFGIYYIRNDSPTLPLDNPYGEERDPYAPNEGTGDSSANPDTSGGAAVPSTPIITISYTARCVLPGQYRVDSSYLIQGDTGHAVTTPPQTITVGEVGQSSAPQIKLTSRVTSTAV